MTEPVISEFRADEEERPKVRAVRELVGSRHGSVHVKVDENDIELPRPLVAALVAIAESLDQGDAISVVRSDAEVSPAQAAKLLGVSRQFVDRLVADDVLPIRRLPNSTYRKIPIRAVLAYKTVSERKRAGIRELVEEASAAGLSY